MGYVVSYMLIEDEMVAGGGVYLQGSGMSSHDAHFVKTMAPSKDSG
jgi:hypothetical protein